MKILDAFSASWRTAYQNDDKGVYIAWLVNYRMSEQGFVYIMGNNRPTLYTGVTSNLKKRVWLHKNNLVKSFTQKYDLHLLLYYEMLDTIENAIIREKQIKDMDRKDKLLIIKKFNPDFKDLADQINKY